MQAGRRGGSPWQDGGRDESQDGSAWWLPHGLPVPLAALTDHQRAYIRRAPAGFCTVTDGQVVRHVTRPCQVRLATVRAASASQLALDASEKFTTFCARRVIITRAPSVHYPEKLLEFGY